VDRLDRFDFSNRHTRSAMPYPGRCNSRAARSTDDPVTSTKDLANASTKLFSLRLFEMAIGRFLRGLLLRIVSIFCPDFIFTSLRSEDSLVCTGGQRGDRWERK